MTNKFTWYGHATRGLETGGYKLVIDPFFSGNPAASTSAEAVEADYLLVSHGHGDHVGDGVAIAKRTGATVISNAEISGWFVGQGVKAHAQHIGGGYNHPFGYLKLTLALHGSALPDGAISIGAVWLVSVTRDVIGPLYNAWVNQRLDSDTRATVISMSSQVDAIGQVVSGPLAGLVSLWSVQAALSFAGLLITPALPLIARANRLHSDKE